MTDFEWTEEVNATRAAAHGTFDAVFLCTGNRFRSALAEGVFRRATASADVSVRSFGTLRLDALPALPEAVELAREHGVDLSEHTCRSLSGRRLDDVDLVVGFELLHAATAVMDAGARRERAFLLPELLAYLEELRPSPDGTSDGARRAIEAAAVARREGPIRAVEEIPDPLGRSEKVQAAIAADVASRTSRLATLLFG